MIFRDREHAGDVLASRLAARRFNRPLVLAVARGGVPVARRVADALGAPLDLLMVRKVGVPRKPEVAAAFVVDGDRPEIVFNDKVIEAAGLTRQAVEQKAVTELHEIEKRRARYLDGRPSLSVSGRDVILVDDGIGTNTNLKPAIEAIGRRGPARIIVAVPVAPPQALEEIQSLTDDVICAWRPEAFSAVGCYYIAFPRLTDEDVTGLLDGGAPPESAKV